MQKYELFKKKVDMVFRIIIFLFFVKELYSLKKRGEVINN